MAHIHSVYDTNSRFRIDPSTRVISKMFDGEVKLVQYDHNSERFAFEIPRFIDGHDMSLCNAVELHYINIGSENFRTNGMYDIDDLQVDPTDDSKVICSWLISQNATLYGGSISFMIRFKCTTETGELSYVWNTATYTGMVVSGSMDNEEVIVEQRVDILEQWRAQLFNPPIIDAVYDKINAVSETTTIIAEAEGTTISVNDSAAEKPREFSIYGRTEAKTIDVTGDIPSPSPEHPQELNTIAIDGGVNINVTGKNLFNVDKFVELVKHYDPNAIELVVDGRRCIKIESYRIYKQDFSQVVQFVPNKIYTFSMDIRYAGNYGENTTTDSLYIGFLYNDESPITADINTAPTGISGTNRRKRYSGDSCTGSFIKADVTSAEGQYCSGFGFSWSVRGYWYIDLDSIQIEEGTTFTAY